MSHSCKYLPDRMSHHCKNQCLLVPTPEPVAAQADAFWRNTWPSWPWSGRRLDRNETRYLFRLLSFTLAQHQRAERHKSVSQSYFKLGADGWPDSMTCVSIRSTWKRSSGGTNHDVWNYIQYYDWRSRSIPWRGARRVEERSLSLSSFFCLLVSDAVSPHHRTNEHGSTTQSPSFLKN